MKPTIKIKTIGFWKNQNVYMSNVLFKKDIPTYCRMQFIRNMYKKKGDKRPDYIAYFVPMEKDERVESVGPYFILRKQIEDDLAGRVFSFISNNQEYIYEAIHNGIDSSGLYDRVYAEFDEP